jgi:hypothetical protein
MLPHAFLRPFPMGLVPAAMSPMMSGGDALVTSSGPQNVNR